ncbi:MAG: arsenate reductase/protein-tyrosine-phosphatase family protein [Promethearchaeota archaeon]
METLIDTARKVLVICLGNTCRSPAAEGFIRKFARDFFPQRVFQTLEIRSAGLDIFFSGPQDRSIRFVKELEGEDISRYVTRKITREMVKDFDIILVMERYMKQRIISMYPDVVGVEGKIILFKAPCIDELPSTDLEVQDPYTKSNETYLQIVKEIRDYSKCFVKKWHEKLKV